MKKKICLTLAPVLMLSSLNALECKKQNDDLKSVRDIIQTSPKTADKEIDLVDGFRAMFEEGKTSGQIRSVYASYDKDTSSDTYATAVGGSLKYELAKFNGLNAGFELTYSEDISSISGNVDSGRRNDELSSGDGRYAQLSQAYLAYEGCILDYKLGRQVIDTPLADSDDIRMVQNTFEGLVAQYPSESLNITLGYLNRWQGVDAGLDDEWVNTGDDGTSFIGVSYSDLFDAQAWYYNINGGENSNSAIYAELSYKHEISDEFGISGSFQYLKESEQDNSNIEANIYGAMLEVELSSLTLGLAYNKSLKESTKSSFSGFGGGTLFTNMDIMIIDEITSDRDASSYVAGATYSLGDFSFLYAYGDFKGDVDSALQKEHIVEQDMGIEYNFNDEFVAYLMYVKSTDKQNTSLTDYDFDHVRFMANYNF